MKRYHLKAIVLDLERVQLISTLYSNVLCCYVYYEYTILSVTTLNGETE